MPAFVSSILHPKNALRLGQLQRLTGLYRHNSTKPYYVTTPIFYPNASPHIGHLYSLVTADVFARYNKLKGRDVRFLAGTDEHGLKIQKASKVHFGEAGREKEFCDSLSQRFRDLGKKAWISNTCYARTTDANHKRAVHNIWKDLDSKGFIYKGKYSGWYSITDECFYTDSQVTTITNAKGETVTTSLETGAVVEWCSEENYMFRLSSFRDALISYYSSNSTSVYPPQYRDDVLQMLGAPAQGSESSTLPELADISISRPRSRLEWGIQVPGDPDHTVYVWFDALLIYLSGAGYPWPSLSSEAPGLPEGWPADLQIIGKDILRFHAIYLPAILLAMSSPSPSAITSSPRIPLAHTILTHAHWTSEQKKMSKSLGNVADPLASMDQWSVDLVRFYLMRIGGRWRGDVDWSERQVDNHSQEIQSQLGNYLLRITSKKITKRVEGVEPSDGMDSLSPGIQGVFEGVEPAETDYNANLLTLTRALPAKVQTHMDTWEVACALDDIIHVLKYANKAVTAIAPWSNDCDPQTVLETRMVGLEAVRVVGGCLEPIMPNTAQKIQVMFGIHENVFGETGKADAVHGLKAFWDRWHGRKVDGVKLFEIQK
ncbi:tRNA synthetases class I (M)-domain-containing protein [Panaeolus papilionaceus]|nr:tRNA synthetases class I (M)-domain-containing protein [Panaeolus papilionaceus]